MSRIEKSSYVSLVFYLEWGKSMVSRLSARAMWCELKRLIIWQKLFSTLQNPSLNHQAFNVQNREEFICVRILFPGLRKINGIKNISKGNVMWIKASGNSTDTFLYNTVSKLSTVRKLLSRIGAENYEEKLWSCNFSLIFCKRTKSMASKGYNISKGDVMWIKASDNSTEAFFHISASEPEAWSTSFYPELEKRLKSKIKTFISIYISSFRVGKVRMISKGNKSVW